MEGRLGDQALAFANELVDSNPCRGSKVHFFFGDLCGPSFELRSSCPKRYSRQIACFSVERDQVDKEA